ncbi:M20/M25/M40 family metallo-hydrolase [Siphonobacter sp. SORGH_AS_0500]|uniref:M20/M25/M40 family metallo-hydrolase n=1 Tax=Siphonobacter sp. SORGH_AS_0500 TaxID=1864824 RepID=UPI0028671F59|nr:M20/M25/M40 family metallo-hydrolase [Siphonobacter sp. SORGH_AS_0500]MDR6195369.1 tripeptide aminopeptidase [Siphonobacter sp. SORGH_AS_0500]
MKKTIMLALLVGVACHFSWAQKSASKLMAEKKYDLEINTLANKPIVKKAFQTILDLEPETRKEHLLLTEIPSPPFKEQVRARKYAELMKAAGADSVWMDEVGNVLGKVKGKTGKKTVVLEAHLDTVFPEGTDVKVKFKGDTLYAPGIGDDTRGLTVVLAVLKAMKMNKIKTDGDVLFVGAVGEEGLGDLRGVKHLFSAKGPKIDSYLAVDGAGLGGITNGGVGSVRYRVTFKGPGGHSYGAFGLVNPHHALAKAIYYFTQQADEFTKSGAKTTYSVSVIGGGTSVNAIPYESWMEVDMRSENQEKLAGINQLFLAAVDKGLKEENAIKRNGADLTVNINKVGDRPSGLNPESNPLIQRMIAITHFFKAEPSLHSSSTNANIPFSKGIPAATIGIGGVGGNGHSLHEWWLNDKGYLGIQQSLLILLAEAGLAE